MSGIVRDCQGLLGIVKVFQGLSRIFRDCYTVPNPRQGLSGIFRDFQNFQDFQGFSGIVKDFQGCQGLGIVSRIVSGTIYKRN